MTKQHKIIKTENPFYSDYLNSENCVNSSCKWNDKKFEMYCSKANVNGEDEPCCEYCMDYLPENRNLLVEKIIDKFKLLSRVPPKSPCGIPLYNNYWVSIPNLRLIAKNIGKNHKLAHSLWETEIHDARILASMIEQIEYVTKQQIIKWTSDFDSWDICDQCCNNLFRKSELAIQLIPELILSKQEFTKRAAFVLIAVQAVHEKTKPDSYFTNYFSLMTLNLDDDRNYVRKAASWAFRQIGKKNMYLNQKVLEWTRTQNNSSKTINWILKDIIKEI